MIEPIELYLGFDDIFFRQERQDTEGATKTEKKAIGDRYKQLLEGNNKVLNRVLANNAQPEDLPHEFYNSLGNLIAFEDYAPANIRKNLGIKTEDLAAVAGVEGLTEEHREYLCGRVPSHLCRLMLPEKYYPIYFRMRGFVGRNQNQFCAAFGKEFIQHVSAITPDTADSTKIQEVIGFDGEGTFNFWTLAPYVHLDIKQRGSTPAGSMARIFDWIRRSSEDRMEHTDYRDIGIWELSPATLGYDERMPTHLRARLAAKITARELIG